MKDSKLVVRGFLRAQIVDGKTKKICGDSGWCQNTVTNEGLQNLAKLLGAQAGSYAAGGAAIGTQTNAINVTQTTISGTAAFRTIGISTSGNATVTVTAAFSSNQLTAAVTAGAAGIYKTNAEFGGSMIAAQTFSASQWNTNQDFNLTYQIRFSTV